MDVEPFKKSEKWEQQMENLSKLKSLERMNSLVSRNDYNFTTLNSKSENEKEI
jgi:hypothetical protein